jgi:hypothetical protein
MDTFRDDNVFPTQSAYHHKLSCITFNNSYLYRQYNTVKLKFKVKSY